MSGGAAIQENGSEKTTSKVLAISLLGHGLVVSLQEVSMLSRCFFL